MKQNDMQVQHPTKPLGVGCGGSQCVFHGATGLIIVGIARHTADKTEHSDMLAGEAKALHTTKRSSGIDVSDPELALAWASVRQDSDPQINWCAFNHAEVSFVVRECIKLCDPLPSFFTSVAHSIVSSERSKGTTMISAAVAG